MLYPYWDIDSPVVGLPSSIRELHRIRRKNSDEVVHVAPIVQKHATWVTKVMRFVWKSARINQHALWSGEASFWSHLAKLFTIIQVSEIPVSVIRSGFLIRRARKSENNPSVRVRVSGWCILDIDSRRTLAISLWNISISISSHTQRLWLVLTQPNSSY